MSVVDASTHKPIYRASWHAPHALRNATIWNEEVKIARGIKYIQKKKKWKIKRRRIEENKKNENRNEKIKNFTLPYMIGDH